MGCRSGEGAARALKGNRLPGAGTDHSMFAADFTYIISQNTSIDLFYYSSINFELRYGTISQNKSKRKSALCICTLDLVVVNHYLFVWGNIRIYTRMWRDPVGRRGGCLAGKDQWWGGAGAAQFLRDISQYLTRIERLETLIEIHCMQRWILFCKRPAKSDAVSAIWAAHLPNTRSVDTTLNKDCALLYHSYLTYCRFYILYCYCDGWTNFWSLPEFKKSHVPSSKIFVSEKGPFWFHNSNGSAEISKRIFLDTLPET